MNNLETHYKILILIIIEVISVLILAAFIFPPPQYNISCIHTFTNIQTIINYTKTIIQTQTIQQSSSGHWNYITGYKGC